MKVTTALVTTRWALDEGLARLDTLRRAGVRPTVQVYGALMAKVEHERRPDVALRLLSQLRHDGLALNEVLATSAISALGRGGCLDGAAALLRELGPRADLKAFGALIAAFAAHGRADAVEALHAQLLSRGLRPDERIHGSRIVAHSRAGQPEMALSLLEQLLADGHAPHLAACNTLIAACEASAALRVFQQMQQHGTAPNSATFAALARACGTRAVAGGVRSGLLRPAAGYAAHADRLSLWPHDVLAKETFWRCPAEGLQAIGEALAGFHADARRLTRATAVIGPALAQQAARAVQQALPP